MSFLPRGAHSTIIAEEPNSPGLQTFSDTVDIKTGTVVFSVAGNVAASEGNAGWDSGTYSVMNLNGNALTLGVDVRIVIELGGDVLQNALMATEENSLVFENLATAINLSNTEYYTEELLTALSENMTFIASSDAEGIVAGVTIAPGASLNHLVQEHVVSVQDGSVYLNFSMTTVPEPTTATLSLLALAGLAARRRRR